jgi:hypothetical protein
MGEVYKRGTTEELRIALLSAWRIGSVPYRYLFHSTLDIDGGIGRGGHDISIVCGHQRQAIASTTIPRSLTTNRILLIVEGVTSNSLVSYTIAPPRIPSTYPLSL